jgi:hypothetical protein
MNKNLVAMVAVALLAGPLAAQAIPMRLDATSQNSSFSNFFVEFEDTGDQLLQFNEVTAFSGVTLGTSFNDILVTVAEIPGFATFSGGGAFFPAWAFGRSPEGGLIFPNVSILPSQWSYSMSTTSVPEPGTLAMFVLGLVGLGFARRRRATN